MFYFKFLGLFCLHIPLEKIFLFHHMGNWFFTSLNELREKSCEFTETQIFSFITIYLAFCEYSELISRDFVNIIDLNLFFDQYINDQFEFKVLCQHFMWLIFPVSSFPYPLIEPISLHTIFQYCNHPSYTFTGKIFPALFHHIFSIGIQRIHLGLFISESDSFPKDYDTQISSYLSSFSGLHSQNSSGSMASINAMNSRIFFHFELDDQNLYDSSAFVSFGKNESCFSQIINLISQQCMNPLFDFTISSNLVDNFLSCFNDTSLCYQFFNYFIRNIPSVKYIPLIFEKLKQNSSTTLDFLLILVKTISISNIFYRFSSSFHFFNFSYNLTFLFWIRSYSNRTTIFTIKSDNSTISLLQHNSCISLIIDDDVQQQLSVPCSIENWNFISVFISKSQINIYFNLYLISKKLQIQNPKIYIGPDDQIFDILFFHYFSSSFSLDLILKYFSFGPTGETCSFIDLPNFVSTLYIPCTLR